MRFVLHLSALDGDDETHRLIDRLVDRIADEVHRIDVPEADHLQDSGWYAGARPTRRKVLTSAVAVPPRKHSSSHGPHKKRIDVQDLVSARLADKFAHSPLVILVEDREADGLLLDILVQVLGPQELRDIWSCGQATTPRAFEIDTAGGINAMPQRVRRIVSDAAAEGRPARLFVLCDSDARWPDDPGPSHASIDELRRECETQSIPLHVLFKRNAENYVPDSVILAARNDSRNVGNVHRFDALLRRTSTQRNHFPLKDGLNVEERDRAVAAGLYAPEEGPDLDLLRERLFPKRPRLLVQLWEERQSQFAGPGLSARDGIGELDSLLDAIAGEM